MKIPRRRGLSPIIAELLLVAVTVVLGTTIFYIGTSSIGGYSNGFSVLFGSNANSAREIYVVEYAQFLTTPNRVNITVRNVGTIETQLADLSFFNLTKTTGTQSQTFSASQITVSARDSWCTKTTSYITIPVGNFCTLTVTFGWGNGATYNLVASTSRGNSVVVQEIT